MKRGFTLIELLAVITIIVIVSAVALPTVIPALSHRQVGEAARILQSALVGARDAAIKINAPAGIRLLPDPSIPLVRKANGQLDATQPLAASAIIPLEQVPDYDEGLVLAWVGALPQAIVNLAYPGERGLYGQTFPIMAVEAVVDANGLPNPPTSWFWNVRVGDKIRINQAGAWYTVMGPMVNGPGGRK